MDQNYRKMDEYYTSLIKHNIDIYTFYVYKYLWNLYL